MNDTVLNIGFYVTYALAAIAAAAVIIFPIIFFFQDIKKARGALLGIGLLAVILVISYMLGTNETDYGVNVVAPVESQLIGGGIIATMILVGLGLVAAVFTEIYKLFR